MNRVALKMLMGDGTKFAGILFGLAVASFLMSEQMAVFAGLMARTFGTVTDTSLPQIWVMDPKVQFIDDLKPLQDTMLQRVRSVDGVAWAVPFYKGLQKARLDNGAFQTCNVFGLDDATLIGGPPEMVEGTLADLRRADGVIVDIDGAHGKLARKPTTAGGKPVPLRVGDTLELNDHRATVVGLCRVSHTFQSQPVVYTTFTRAVTFAPRERKMLTFVLATPLPGQDAAAVCAHIHERTGLQALTRAEFKEKTVMYFIKYTGIPFNFGISVLLAFIVGTAIAGQTFYNFTHDNLRQFGALKAMGASNGTLLRMILLQAVLVGVIGYGLGVGGAAWVGWMTSGSELAFLMLWQIPLATAVAIILICAISALISIIKVIRLEPAIVFKS